MYQVVLNQKQIQNLNLLEFKEWRNQVIQEPDFWRFKSDINDISIILFSKSEHAMLFRLKFGI